MGLAKKQFWRAVWALRKRKPKDNYPFTSLLSGIHNDTRAGLRLRRFRTSVLKAVLERINQDEAELRERLTAVVGNPTGLVLLGVASGIFTAWESYSAHFDSMGHSALFGASLGTLLLAGAGFRHRIALFELSRCRGLLSLEIARRSDQDHETKLVQPRRTR